MIFLFDALFNARLILPLQGEHQMMLILVSVLIVLVALVAIIGYSYQLGMNSGVSLMSRKVEGHLKEVEEYLGGDEKCATLVYYLRSRFNIRVTKG